MSGLALKLGSLFIRQISKPIAVSEHNWSRGDHEDLYAVPPQPQSPTDLLTPKPECHKGPGEGARAF